MPHGSNAINDCNDRLTSWIWFFQAPPVNAPPMITRHDHVSVPLAALLKKTGMPPRHLSDVIERQFRPGFPAMVRRGQIEVDKIAAATGLNIVTISRRHRYLLVRIEEFHEQKSWIYEELSRNLCRVSVPGTLPFDVRAQARGKTLSCLVDLPPPFADLKIKAVDDDNGDWTIADIDPVWQLI